MKPIEFKERTGILLKPRYMTDEECEPLPIHHDGRCTSWTGSGGAGHRSARLDLP